MPEYYEVQITKTAKAYGPHRSGYSLFDHRVETFAKADGAAEFVANEYSKPCKKSKVYLDGPDGEAIHIGWVYHFNDVEEKAWRQDWVVVNHIQSTPVLIERGG